MKQSIHESPFKMLEVNRYSVNGIPALSPDAFRTLLNQIRPDSDAAWNLWLEFASELEDSDSSGHEHPCGTYKLNVNFLYEFATYFCEAMNEYGLEAAQKLIQLAELHSCPYPWEMPGAAKQLASGTRPEDMWELIESGTIEEALESYCDRFPSIGHQTRME